MVKERNIKTNSVALIAQVKENTKKIKLIFSKLKN